jgi:1,4-dihydroxy-2-naphthoate octaprenyltransferase
MLVAAVLVLFVETVFARLSTAYPDLDPDGRTGKRTLAVLLGPRHVPLAFVAIACVMLVLTATVAPFLPEPAWQRASFLGVALAAAAIAWIIHSGRGAKTPVLVPMIAIGAYGASLTTLLLASWRR